MSGATAPSERITIAVTGSGEAAARWLRALRGVDATAAEPIELNSPDDLLATLARDDVTAIAFDGATADLAGAVKRALMVNRHVMVFGATALASKQLLALDALARRRARVLQFAEEGFGDERVAFVRRMTAEPQPIWRTRYLRSLRTGPASGDSLDALAISEIAFATMLLGGMPARVSALAPRIDDESGAAGAAMLTLVFDGGPAARIDVSLIEPEPRHEVTLACENRTIVLDAYNSLAPLRILTAVRGRGTHSSAPGGSWAETISEHPAPSDADALARAAASFVSAVRARDGDASNARQLAEAALIWERARESMSRGGAFIDIEPQAEPRRPKLKLIVGGGHVDDSRPAPDLTIIDGGRRAPSPSLDPDPEPLRTA